MQFTLYQILFCLRVKLELFRNLHKNIYRPDITVQTSLSASVRLFLLSLIKFEALQFFKFPSIWLRLNSVLSVRLSWTVMDGRHVRVSRFYFHMMYSSLENHILNQHYLYEVFDMHKSSKTCFSYRLKCLKIS